MKILTKSLIVASVVGSLGLGGLSVAGIANAETASSTTSPASSLIDKIASTFNIDKTKLTQLFDQDREAKDAERKKEESAKLDTLVSNGTITAAQRTAIETEKTKLVQEREADRDAMKDLTDAERKEKMDAMKTELENWAKAQGLDLTKLEGVFGPGGHGGPGGPR